MTQHRSAAEGPPPGSQGAQSYYQRLGVSQTASMAEIRQAYRQKSKLYHPDTTSLPTEAAAERFRQLNEAYATLSNPEQRQYYDRQQSARRAMQGLQRPTSRPSIHRRRASRPFPSSVNLDSKQRPLSAGEVFALFLLGITFMGCLTLALVLGLNRSDVWLKTSPLYQQWQHTLTQLQRSQPQRTALPQHHAVEPPTGVPMQRVQAQQPVAPALTAPAIPSDPLPEPSAMEPMTLSLQDSPSADVPTPGPGDGVGEPKEGNQPPPSISQPAVEPKLESVESSSEQ